MSLVSVYDALKAAGVDDAKAVAAVRDLESAQESRHIERRLIRLEVSVAVIIALQIGQILLIMRLLTG